MPEPAPKAFKSQPWILFDNVVSPTFLLGDGVAAGSQSPAISLAGEIVFFQGGGRTKAQMPWYTNLDISGQLAYGMEVWQIYLHAKFPRITPDQNNGTPTANPGVAPTVKLAEAILNFGVLELELGQENQMVWPCTRFGAGGGIVSQNDTAEAGINNGIPEGANVLKLAEPIEMPRTQNMNAKIRLAPEAQTIIGTPTAPGVGNPLLAYSYAIDGVGTVTKPQLPFALELGFVGRRVKKTQYGQLPQDGTPGQAG